MGAQKVDLFSEKVKTDPEGFKAAFPTYTGRAGDVQTAANHVASQYRDRIKSKKAICAERAAAAAAAPAAPVMRPLADTHLTCATDTSNVRIIFAAVKDIILRENLKASE